MDSTIEAHDARRLAVIAMVDPATVRAFLAGRSVRGLSAMRIRAALAELGLVDPTQDSARDEGIAEGRATSAVVMPGPTEPATSRRMTHK